MNERQKYNRKFLWIGAAVVLLVVTACAGLPTLSFIRDRQATNYPAALHLTSHSNYSRLPANFRWDDTYSTPDNVREVFYWYSTTFDMGTESRANGTCTFLEANHQIVLNVERYMSVLICDHGQDRKIFVHRTTYLKRTSSEILN